MKHGLGLLLIIVCCSALWGQDYEAGFKSVALVDSSRVYKPNTSTSQPLHYRPVELDIWYPSEEKGNQALTFGELFQLFEQRAVKYQDEQDYTGISNELAQFYVAELGVGTDPNLLLQIQSQSYAEVEPAQGSFPLIIYMAGFNGMGFENYRLLEQLAQQGFMVVSIWSVGRYPGDMTNQKEDMLEQVYDAEFALSYLKAQSPDQFDFERFGLLACSWGGMSAAHFLKQNPEVKAFVSLDGTENHYFGEEDENDNYIKKIHAEGLLDPAQADAAYLYLESGDKLEEFKANSSYDYYGLYQGDKSYLRLLTSKHEYFSCIPAILESSPEAVKNYALLGELSLMFFKENLARDGAIQETLASDGGFQEVLARDGGFQEAFDKAKASKMTTSSRFVLSDNTRSEVRLSGKILDRENGLPLPYVNIGLTNHPIGTVSNTEGTFSLDLPTDAVEDSLRVSCIGYQPLVLSVQSIQHEDKPLVLEMKESVQPLREIIIPSKGLKRNSLGNKTESKFLGTGFSYNQLGAEMGIPIRLRKSPTFVEAFHCFVSYNRLSSPTIFRLNFYSVQGGKPDKNLLQENILLRIEPKQVGKLSIDLEPYDLVLDQDVIVTLEWVDSEGENLKGEAIFFSLGMFNAGTLYKQSSQAKFRKHSSLGVGFYLDVQY